MRVKEITVLLATLLSIGLTNTASAQEFIIRCDSEDDGDLVARVKAEVYGNNLSFNGAIGVMPKSRLELSGYLSAQDISAGMQAFDQVSLFLANKRELAGATTSSGARGETSPVELRINPPASFGADPEGVSCTVLAVFPVRE